MIKYRILRERELPFSRTQYDSVHLKSYGNVDIWWFIDGQDLVGSALCTDSIERERERERGREREREGEREREKEREREREREREKEKI